MINPFRIPRTVGNIQRFRQILSLLIEYGFGEVAVALGGMPSPWSRFFRLLRPPPPGSRPQRFVAFLERLGPTFIKFGQVLSTRADLLPEEWIAELRKLQDQVSPVPFPEIERVIARSIPDYREVFAEVDPNPLASASLGQVHSARLRSGEEVVLKVIRPGVREVVRQDLDLMRTFARLLEERVPELQSFRPRAVVEEFARSIQRELDLNREARNIERFRRNFAQDPRIVIPKVYQAWTTADLLVMERIYGVKITEYEKVGSDPRFLANLGVELIFKMCFVDRFFHADPHPGNTWVLPPGDRIALLDMGMADVVLPQTRDLLVEMLAGVVLDDPERIVSAVLSLAYSPEDLDLSSFRREIYFIYEDYVRGATLEKANVAELFEACFKTARKFSIRIPTDIVLLIRALATMEGVGKSLCPDIDLVEAARPYVLKLLEERMSPERFGKDLVEVAMDSYQLLRTLPRRLDRILKMEEEGRRRERIVLEGIEGALRSLTRGVQLTAFAILIFTLTYAGLILLPPSTFGSIRVIMGASLFLLAGASGAYLLLRFRRG